MSRSEAERRLRKFLLRLRRTTQRDALRHVAALERHFLAIATGIRPTRTMQRDLQRALRELAQDALDRQQSVVVDILNSIQGEYAKVTQDLFRVAGLEPALARNLYEEAFADLERGLLTRKDPITGRTARATIVRRTLFAWDTVDRVANTTKNTVKLSRVATELANILMGQPSPLLQSLGMSARHQAGLRSLRRGFRTIIVTAAYEAMRQGTQVANTQSPIIRAAKWTLSARHHTLPSSPDVCDLYATLDNGLGPGWYPINEWPKAPHPNCGCYAGRVRAYPATEWAERANKLAAKASKKAPKRVAGGKKRPTKAKKVQRAAKGLLPALKFSSRDPIGEAGKFFEDLGIREISIHPYTPTWLLEDVALELEQFKEDGYPMVPRLYFQDLGMFNVDTPAQYTSWPADERGTMTVNITSIVYQSGPDDYDKWMEGQGDKGWFSTDDPGHPFAHEYGHFLHDEKLKAAGDHPVGWWNALAKRGLFDTAEQRSHFIDDPNRRTKLQAVRGNWLQRMGFLPGTFSRRISGYGEDSPAEFVTEVFTGMLNGKKYDRDVMEWYRTFKGPEIR